MRTAGGPRSEDHRLVEWIELVGDLLQRPRPEFPRARLGRQLLDTFEVRAVSWEWRAEPDRPRCESWRPVGRAHLPPPWQDYRPRAADWEQQLSIPYVLHGSFYEAVVLGRDGAEFGGDELDLARHLQGLIRGLYLRFAPAGTGTWQPAESCVPARHIRLTATELAVLALLADGHTTYGIAVRLHMATRTASKHLEHIYRKLGVTHRFAAVTAAHEAGLVRDVS